MSSNEFERRIGETEECYLERLEYQSKRDHGGAATYHFMAISIVLLLVTRTKVLSFLIVGYFLGGMFLAAILSIPTNGFSSLH